MVPVPSCWALGLFASSKVPSGAVQKPSAGLTLLRMPPAKAPSPKAYDAVVAQIEATSAPQFAPPTEGGTTDDGIAFLNDNREKPGVVTLPCGLQYRVLKSGPATGKSPLKNTECAVHYRGKLIPAQGGTEFDSSYKRGKPANFAPSKVVQGWTIALQLMGVGDKWAIYVPSEFAYGDAGRSDEKRGQYIPAGAVLCFELELLSVKGPSKAKPVRPDPPPKKPTDGSFEPSPHFEGPRPGFGACKRATHLHPLPSVTFRQSGSDLTCLTEQR